MGVASLVLGILSLVFSFTVKWLGAILGLIGIILGAVARKKNPEKKGAATAGLVMSIIGFVLSVILFIACMACVGAML